MGTEAILKESQEESEGALARARSTGKNLAWVENGSSSLIERAGNQVRPAGSKRQIPAPIARIQGSRMEKESDDRSFIFLTVS
jgi:hypothetical protein